MSILQSRHICDLSKGANLYSKKLTFFLSLFFLQIDLEIVFPRQKKLFKTAKKSILQSRHICDFGPKN